MTSDLQALHAPYAVLLRAALAAASPQEAERAIDIGCGGGLKTSWLAEQLVCGGVALGLDIDRNGLRAAARAQGGAWVAGDAQALPLRQGTIDLAWIVATLDLCADPVRVLTEVGSILRPRGALVVASVAQLWVRLRSWPAELYAATMSGPPVEPADGLGDDLDARLAMAGLVDRTVRAYLLDPPGMSLARAALPLVSWNSLAPLVASSLAPALRDACAAAEAAAEPEARAVLFVTTANRPSGRRASRQNV